MLYEWLHILEEETQEESCARIHPHIQIRTICFDANFVPRKPGCLRFSQLYHHHCILVIEVNFSLHYTLFIKKNSLCSNDAAPIASLIVLFSVLTPLLLPPHKFLRSFYWLRKPSGSLCFPRIPGKRELTPYKPGKPEENISGFPEFPITLPCQKSSNGIWLLRHLRFLSEFAIFM